MNSRRKWCAGGTPPPLFPSVRRHCRLATGPSGGAGSARGWSLRASAQRAMQRRLGSRLKFGHLRLAEAGGLQASRRWLSAATPPGLLAQESAPRTGCQPHRRHLAVSKPGLVEIAGVILDLCFFEHLDQFFAKRSSPMMLRLPHDVLMHSPACCGTDGERGIPFLPCEAGKPELLMHPGRGGPRLLAVNPPGFQNAQTSGDSSAVVPNLE